MYSIKLFAAAAMAVLLTGNAKQARKQTLAKTPGPPDGSFNLESAEEEDGALLRIEPR
jgi:hypothetical protein